MNETPNLDCMGITELREYTKTASGQLREYAENKARAIECRLTGGILQARYFESRCERIYC
jgi:hypothetical protein